MFAVSSDTPLTDWYNATNEVFTGSRQQMQHIMARMDVSNVRK